MSDNRRLVRTKLSDDELSTLGSYFEELCAIRKKARTLLLLHTSLHDTRLVDYALERKTYRGFQSYCNKWLRGLL